MEEDKKNTPTKSGKLSEKSAKPLKYAGPFYVKGIYIPGKGKVAPAKFNQKEIRAFIKDFPQYEKWFKEQ